MQDEFFCHHCLEATETEDYPAVCPHCLVGRCTSCHTRLKASAKFCHGCAEIKPTVQATMSRSSSTSGAYAELNWGWEGLLTQADTLPILKEKRRPRYGISVGWESGEDMDAGLPAKAWIREEFFGESMSGNKVRELTYEEEVVVGYKSPG